MNPGRGTVNAGEGKKCRERDVRKDGRIVGEAAFGRLFRYALSPRNSTERRHDLTIGLLCSPRSGGIIFL